MKKKLFFSLTAMLFGSTVYAQTPIAQSKEGDFYPCIGKFTKSGKGTLIETNVGYDYRNSTYFSIYDDQMNVAKTINIDNTDRTYCVWNESAKVVPTGFSFAYYRAQQRYNYDTGKYEYYEAYNDAPYSEYNEGMDFSDVTTPEQLVEKLKDAGKFSSWDSPYPFTDFKGNLAFMLNAKEYNFLYFKSLGSKYPYNGYFYTLIDGNIYRVNGYSLSNYGDLLYSSENVEWVIDEDSKEEHQLTDGITGFRYRDYDNNTEVDHRMYLTQTMFNDDDKWEYMVREYKVVPIPEEDKTVSREEENGDGTVTLTRKAGETYEYDRLVVYNEDGEECYSLDGIEYIYIYHLYGKDYIYAYEVKDANGDYYNYLYAFDKPTTSIHEVARTKSSRVKAEENAVIIEVDEELSGSDVMVADAGGRLVGRGRIEKGNNSARVAMPTHTPGVYVVSLKRGNNVLDSHKMVIK